MTQLVSRLERHGLAERRGHRDDRRVVMVHITPAGRELLDQRRQQRAIRLAGLLDALSPEDERTIAAALPALTRLTDLHAPAPEQPLANPEDIRAGAIERETA
jgi:DNA-binding MarR family transcriptional regulator